MGGPRQPALPVSAYWGGKVEAVTFEEAAKQMALAARAYRTANLQGLARMANTSPERVEEILADMHHHPELGDFKRRFLSGLAALREEGQRFGEELMGEIESLTRYRS